MDYEKLSEARQRERFAKLPGITRNANMHPAELTPALMKTAMSKLQYRPRMNEG